LAINYGLFVESNGKKMRRARLKRINERCKTRPARTYFCGIQITTSIAQITLFSRTSPCSTIIT
jgi:hypothetical protein